MIRKATAFVLLVVLGLYLPVAAMPVCLCLEKEGLDPKEACCTETTSCCEDHKKDTKSCCGDPDCCIVIPGFPDGMEPELMKAPSPVSLPAPMMLVGEFVTLPSPKSLRAPVSFRAPPPPPGGPIRIAIGVWRI